MQLHQRSDIAQWPFAQQIAQIFADYDPEVIITPMIVSLTYSQINNTILPGTTETAEWFKGQESEKVLLAPLTKSKARTKAQNRLYFKWVGEIADYRGVDSAEMHEKMKRHYCHAKLLESNDEYVGIWAGISEQKDEEKLRSEELVKNYICSTTRLSPKAFSEMLDWIERDARMKGIPLTVTGDLYDLAGVK